MRRIYTNFLVVKQIDNGYINTMINTMIIILNSESSIINGNVNKQNDLFSNPKQETNYENRSNFKAYHAFEEDCILNNEY